MSLKEIAKQKFMEDVINNGNDVKTELLKWRFLIVDDHTTKIVSAVTSFSELSEYGIYDIQNIRGFREAHPTNDAIYFITPTDKNISALLKDFSYDFTHRQEELMIEKFDRLNPFSTADKSQEDDGRKYKAAHIYFTETCPDDLFKKLEGIVQDILTLKEISMSFVPVERQVFSLENSNGFEKFYEFSPNKSDMEKMAEQLATLCSSLGELPTIQYRAGIEQNLEFAKMVRKKLEFIKTYDTEIGEGSVKAKSVLLILDRGFDTISPLVHELSYQAMIHDVIPIVNNIYTHEGKEGRQLKIFLEDEDDEFWVEYRHNHIAELEDKIDAEVKRLKKVEDEQKAISEKMKESQTKPDALKSKEEKQQKAANFRNQKHLIKKIPDYQRKKKLIMKHDKLWRECMEKYNKIVKILFESEQCFATRTNENGRSINVNDLHKTLEDLLSSSTFTDLNNENLKLRIILLYIQAINGITEDQLKKKIAHANISNSEEAIKTIKSLNKLMGVEMIRESENEMKLMNYITNNNMKRKSRKLNGELIGSRWTPILKDIIEDCIDDKLDQTKYPILGRDHVAVNLNTVKGFMDRAATVANGYIGSKQEGRIGGSNQKNVPRILIYIMGGVTHSELRVGYEITEDRKKRTTGSADWDVVIGGSEILTPEKFLRNLKNL